MDVQRWYTCDVKPCQGYHWPEEFLADQSKLKIVGLYCLGKVHGVRDTRCLGVSHCCYNMADLMEELKEKESEIEIVLIWSKKSQGLKEGRERCLIRPRSWTVRRSDYLTHVSPLHPQPETYCALAWHKTPPQCTPILSKFSFPTPFTNVFLDDFVFLPDTNPQGEGKINPSAESGQE